MRQSIDESKGDGADFRGRERVIIAIRMSHFVAARRRRGNQWPFQHANDRSLFQGMENERRWDDE